MPQVVLPKGTIRYQDSGGPGPVIVLLHGLLMDHTLWGDVVPTLQEVHRCIRPTLPLGSHQIPMHPDADLSLLGQAALVADFLDALDLDQVTLVVADWGGGMLLTHLGRDERVSRLIICPSEAFDNYPPGLPGKLAVVAARLPGGISLALRQLRVGWMRRSPLLLGWMAKRPLDDQLVAGWTAPGLASSEIRRDLRKYARARTPARDLVTMTAALERFEGPALILWASEDRVMPHAHGPRLAGLFRNGELVLVDDSYTLVQLDRPHAVARHMLDFLTRTDSTRVQRERPAPTPATEGDLNR